MALDKDLIRAHVRDGEVGDQDAPAPIDHPTEHLLHADLDLLSVKKYHGRMPTVAAAHLSVRHATRVAPLVTLAEVPAAARGKLAARRNARAPAGSLYRYFEAQPPGRLRQARATPPAQGSREPADPRLSPQ